MKTGTITYNVTERGRKYRGAARRFDTVGLAAVVNSAEVQERVRHRDLWGYYGHWPRMLFGMEPKEGGVVPRGPLAGKVVRLEPAFVTTKLEADTQGNIRHEAEFAETPNGRTAARLFSSKVGGFSSAIDARVRNGVDVPIGFFGFDYVSEPNFSTNRGYALDGVWEEGQEAGYMDSAIVESQLTVRLLDGLYSALQADYERLSTALARVGAERDELVTLLAERRPEKAAQLSTILDSTFQRPIHASRTSVLLDMADEFMTMPLARSAEEEPLGGGHLQGVIDTFTRMRR